MGLGGLGDLGGVLVRVSGVLESLWAWGGVVYRL